ncbi:VanZ family protein [Vagococcus fluvialis]|uniref:VanZ family protein n=2 Tax=Vagococcus fluvialis TaxID=2738 RepID=UPI002B2CD9B3|nr:VanZ family protein [Vagococcus fluvialis]
MGIMVSLILLILFFIRHAKTLDIKYMIVSAMFVLYVSVMLSEVVGFPNIPDIKAKLLTGQAIYVPIVNKIPFSAGVDLSTWLNIIAFFPFGMLLVIMWKRFESFFLTLSTGFLFSVIIEVGQLFTLYRQTDVNDLIMNTLGVFLGWLFAKYVWQLRVRRLEGKNQDWLRFMSYSFVSIFIFG